MADRCSASITIGGTLAQEHLHAFFAAIAAEDLAIDYDEAAFTPEDLVSGEPLTLCANEVSWGTFNILEPFCHTHKLPYTRWNGACSGVWGCGRTIYRGNHDADKGLALTQEYDVSEDDHVLMGAGLARHLGSFEAILGHFAHADFTVPPLVIENVPCPQRATNALQA
jgi:hypothetical protein